MLLSSYFQIPLPARSVAIAEISLTGLIKATNQFTLRFKEIDKYGFKHIFIANDQKKEGKGSCYRNVKSVYELLSLFPEDQEKRKINRAT